MHQRYVVEDGTIVIISPSNSGVREQKVQLIDISSGGMAFIYKGVQSDLEKSGILKLLTKKSLSGKDIAFDTVSDAPAAGSTQTSEQFRRRGVKFKWMGYYEQSGLSELINEIKICEK